MVKNNSSTLEHCAVRIVIFLFFAIISIPIGLSMLNPDRRCGTGDGLSIVFWMLLFYIAWVVFLVIELVSLHRQNKITKRNANIIMSLFLPIIITLIWIYFLILD